MIPVPPPPSPHACLPFCKTGIFNSNKLAEAFEGLPEDEPCGEDEVVVDSQDRKEELEAAQAKPPAGGSHVSLNPPLIR